MGQRTGETFQLGDQVEVKLLEVTPVSGGLRFEMVSEGRKGKPPPQRHGRRQPPEQADAEIPEEDDRDLRQAAARREAPYSNGQLPPTLQPWNLGT